MPFTLDSIRDLDAVMGRRAQAAEDALAVVEVVAGIRYGPHDAETFDLYPARTAGPSPVLMYVHGGFWRSMRARQFAFLAPGFVPFGVALAVIDYPLIPDVRMADIVDSCRRAVAYLHRHGAAHGLDTERIFVAGNSAGGHLVGELMDRTWSPAEAIKGGTSISGLFELAPVAASFQNDTLHLTKDEIARFSPAYRKLDIGAPMIVAVGGEETGEFLRQSASFAEQVRGCGVAVEHMVVPGTNHITVVLDALADPDAELNRAVRRQIGVL